MFSQVEPSVIQQLTMCHREQQAWTSVVQTERPTADVQLACTAAYSGHMAHITESLYALGQTVRANLEVIVCAFTENQNLALNCRA